MSLLDATAGVPGRGRSVQLTADRWTYANRGLLAKAITELMYEEVISPNVMADGALTWSMPEGTITATARRRALGWWRVEPDSVRWDGGELPDAAAVLGNALVREGCDGSTAASFISELAATLVSDTAQLAHGRSAAEIIEMEPVYAEAELRGHPWIIANKGRVGFSTDDLATYAPEMRADVRLHWLAADPTLADVRGIDHTAVVRDQIGDTEFRRLQARAELGGLDPDRCVFLPVHPWQWSNRIMSAHAGDLARGQLVHLGEGPARYAPQLAVRTMTDIDHPDRRYLKLPLSILNTSVYRGLPRERTLVAPDLSSWLRNVVAQDDFLAETGLILLGEVASVSVPHPVYEALPNVPYQHTEMLGAIWREPVTSYLQRGERALSLAALLHIDNNGQSVAEELVNRSGLGAVEWIAQVHEAVLPPLLHVLYRYGSMFSPHGQNCMIVHRHGVPTRLVVKDFVDDLAISSDPMPEHGDLPADVREALSDVTIPPAKLVKYLHNGLLICVYRYLAEIAEDHLGVPEPQFWALARDTLSRHQQRFAAELAERFRSFDLQTPTFPKLCLNRLRLFDRAYHDDPERPVISATGTVRNPLAEDRPLTS